jgi:hypothetical protein
MIVLPVLEWHKYDMRSGTDWEKLDRAEKLIKIGDILHGEEMFNEALNYRMRALWASLGRWKAPGVAQRCGFGIVRPEPIKGKKEAISKYLGKYITKHVEHRTRADKGVRLVEYGEQMRIGNTHFSWISEGSRQWRAKLKVFACSRGVLEFSDMTKLFGPRWAWHFKEAIMETALPPEYIFPGSDCADRYVEHRQEIAHRDWQQAAWCGEAVAEDSPAKSNFAYGPLLLANGMSVRGFRSGMLRSEINRLIQQRKAVLS